MCVVLIIPKDVRPSIETLRLCERANPHGGGIAWRNAGAVEWLKSNDVNEIDKLARKMKGELIIHFRIASVGGVCNELRHPFPVTRNARLDDRGRTGAVLFQNGTWGGYREALAFAASDGHKAPKGEMSDTRAAAFLVSIYGHKFLEKIGGWSRWVYFTAKETVRVGDWYVRDGIYFSNLYWLPPPPPKYTPPQRRKLKQSDFYVDEKEETTGIPACTPKGDDEARELWDMGNIEGYWDKIHAHNRKLKAKRLKNPCQGCEGIGLVVRGGKNVKCPVCDGKCVQPAEPKTESLHDGGFPDEEL